MRQATLPVPEIGLIAATRGLGGAGVALLLADRLSSKKRKAIGWPLLAVGVLSTVPLLVDLVKRVKAQETMVDKEPVTRGRRKPG
jgi:hypothetical protein